MRTPRQREDAVRWRAQRALYSGRMSDTGASMTPRPRRRVLRDEVYDAILEMLVEGQFNGGEIIGIAPLSARLGVSSTPVREALVQLESTGLVARIALRGYKVAHPMSSATIEALFDARLLLEVGIARHAYSHRDTLIPRLERALADQRSHAEQLIRTEGDPNVKLLGEYLATDRMFHDLIAEATGNEFFVEMMQKISVHGQRLRQFAIHRSSDADLAVEEHGRILEAFAANSLAAVLDAVESHVEAARERTLRDERN